MAVCDRAINTQCSRMNNEIYGSLVKVQYPAKCGISPLTQKSQANNFALISFSKNLTPIA